MKDKNLLTLDDLTKGNVWSLSERELSNMLIDGMKQEDFAEMKSHYMNIIRTVFDIQYTLRSKEDEIKKLEQQHYEIFSFPTSEGSEADTIAIRKHRIKKITDLNLDNVQHLDTIEVLELIKNNMGTGWKGLSLSIQDIIESAFFVDTTSLPEATMHRTGGIIDRRKADGYDVLEIIRGNWIEAIFLKAKPKIEKVKIDFSIRDNEDDMDRDNEEDDEDDENEDMPDNNDDMDEDEDEDSDDLENSTPEIEDIDDIENMEDPEDENN